MNNNKDSAILSVKDLSIVYFKYSEFNRVVDNVSIFVEKGKIAGLVGESGSGKTQLALAILGLTQGVPGIISGEIHYEDVNLLENLPAFCKIKNSNGRLRVAKDVAKWKQHHRKIMKKYLGHTISTIFQDPVHSLDPLFSVEFQLGEVLKTKGNGRYNLDKQVEYWLQKVELKDVQRIKKAFPHQLSGGMCQRIMIAMAICSESSLLIADEPTTSLDTPVKYEILELLKHLNREMNLSILLITHNFAVVRHYTDYLFVMNKGKIIDHGITKSFFQKDLSRYKPLTRKMMAMVGELS